MTENKQYFCSKLIKSGVKEERLKVWSLFSHLFGHKASGADGWSMLQDWTPVLKGCWEENEGTNWWVLSIFKGKLVLVVGASLTKTQLFLCWPLRKLDPVSRCPWLHSSGWIQMRQKRLQRLWSGPIPVHTEINISKAAGAKTNH